MTPRRTYRAPWARHLLLTTAFALLTACAHTSDQGPDRRAADIAAAMVGKPYRYGGEGPNGFDCSGLIYYSFQRAGIEVPRDTSAQRKQTRPVARKDLKKGDLLFFNQDGRRSSHVAIFIGGDVFVHAPSRGKRVRTDHLSDAYWRRHFAGARRF